MYLGQNRGHIRDQMVHNIMTGYETIPEPNGGHVQNKKRHIQDQTRAYSGLNGGQYQD